jgi:hypothetical protein
MGSVAKSSMRKGFLIYEEMRKYFVIYEEAVIVILVGARPCAARTRFFGLIATPNRALRAPRPSQLSCSPKNKKIKYFQKQNVFLQALIRAARGIYFSTGLSCTLMSYAAPY